MLLGRAQALRRLPPRPHASPQLCSPPCTWELAHELNSHSGGILALRKILKASANVWKEPQEEGRGVAWITWAAWPQMP